MNRLLLPITILFATVLGSISSVIFAQTPEDSQPNSPTPEVTEIPQPSPTPEATEIPQPSPTPEATEIPQASPTPEATEIPQASPTPKATEIPQASPTPEATEIPQASPTPEATEIPQASPTPEATEIPTPNSEQSQQQGGYMGVQMVTLAPDTIEQINKSPDIDFKVPDTQGILIVEVFPNTPAATAGLRKGDVVTEVSGKSTTTAKEVIDIVTKTSAGDSLNLKVQRGEEIIPVLVELGEKPAK